MIHHRNENEVRRFDIMKLIILVILIALLLWFWLSPPAFVQGTDNGEANTAVATNTDSAADEPMDETIPQIDVPVLEAPVLTNGLEAGPVALSGSGTPGSTVRIIVDGTEVGTAEVGNDGSWSFDLDLVEGSRTLSLEALDAAGDVATTVDFPAFDVTAPPIALAVPTLSLPDGDLPGGSVSLSGTGTPGSNVGIVIDGELLGTATVGDDGSWSFDTDLTAGDHDVRLQAIDLDGNVAGESEGYGLSLSELPAADEDTVEFVPPTFDLPEAGLAGGDVTLSGTGTPGSEVEIVVNGEVVGTAVVADDGTWHFPTTLPAGDYELALRSEDGSGTAVETDPVSFSFVDPDAATDSATPTLDAPADGSAADSGELRFSGTGEPGAEVEILDGELVVGTAVVGEDGSWQFSYTAEPGGHAFAVRNVGGDEASASVNVTINAPVPVDTAATNEATELPANYCDNAEPGIDQGETYIVGLCEWLTKIANRLGINYGDLIGVNPQIEDPNLIYPGQVINLPPR